MIDAFILSHAAAGGIALLCGAVALATKKGLKPHILFGKVFSVCMIYAAISSIIISCLPGHESIFLLVIGVFSLYLITSGWMHLKLKGIQTSTEVPAIFKLNAWMMILAGVAMLTYGSLLLLASKGIGIVLIVFGILGGQSAIGDIKTARNIDKRPLSWLLGHVGNIIGGYIAATTAFLVQNQILPDLIAWLGPTAIGVPFIIYWIRRVKKRGLR